MNVLFSIIYYHLRILNINATSVILRVWLVITRVKTPMDTTTSMEPTLHKLFSVKTQYICIRLYIIFPLHKL